MTDTSQQAKEWGWQVVSPRRDVGAALAALSQEDLLRLRGRGRRVCPSSPFWRASCAASATRMATPPPTGSSAHPARQRRADEPERACAAAEALAAIQRLLVSDAALKVITGMISGMGAEEIRCHCDMTAVEYDTTRRRMLRTILRHGLAWSWP